MSMLVNEINYREKYTILKTILMIILLSADLSITTGVPNTSFYIVILLSTMLIFFHTISERSRKLKYLKIEFPIYSSIFILSVFILIYSSDTISLIHALKLFIIFFVIYPTIKSYFSLNKIIVSLKVNLIVNFILLVLGFVGIEKVSRLTGYLRGSTILNYAGSLYKVAIILVPYLIWDLITKKKKFKTIILLIISIYVISKDGSRTGVISLLIILFLQAFYLSLRFLKKLKVTYSSILNIIILLFMTGMIIFGSYERIVRSNAYIRSFETIKLLFSTNINEFLLKGDSIRGYMILDAIETIKSNYLILGKGFQTTRTRGIVIHNAYLQIFADLGLIPAISLVVLLIYPIVLGIKNMKNNKDLFPSVIVLIVFSFSLLLHPFSVQVSDWALYIIPLSIIMIHLSKN